MGIFDSECSKALMDTKGRLVAGSHNRNEFVLINIADDEVARVSPFIVRAFLIASSNFFEEKCVIFASLTAFKLIYPHPSVEFKDNFSSWDLLTWVCFRATYIGYFFLLPKLLHDLLFFAVLFWVVGMSSFFYVLLMVSFHQVSPPIFV